MLKQTTISSAAYGWHITNDVRSVLLEIAVEEECSRSSVQSHPHGAGQVTWAVAVCDPNARRVFESLSDPAWDFWTIEGLSLKTGLSSEDVRLCLERYAEWVRKADIRDAKGRELFTLQAKPVSLREHLVSALAFLGKAVR